MGAGQQPGEGHLPPELRHIRFVEKEDGGGYFITDDWGDEEETCSHCESALPACICPDEYRH